MQTQTSIQTEEGNVSRRFKNWDAPEYRPVYYDRPDYSKNMDPEVARDMITLYVTCGLGYSPIRHILGYTSDKPIENVIRQHRLGRSITKHFGSWKECRLSCPLSKQLDSVCLSIVKKLSIKYSTLEDEYVAKMIETGTWYDDPVENKKDTTCPDCGAELVEDSRFCHICGRSIERNKKGKIV